MKKLLLSVLFILSISPLLAMVGTNVPTKADEIIFGGNSYVEDTITQSEYNRLNYSGLLTEFLRQGGTVDISNINEDYGVDDVINEIGETIVDVLTDFGQTVEWLGDSIFQSEGTVYPENIKPRVNEKLSNNIGFLLGIIPFLNSTDSPEDTPDVPEDYLPYIQKINDTINTGFFWKNYTFSNTGFPSPAISIIPSSVSFYSTRNWTQTNNNIIGDIISGTGQMFVSSYITVNITLQENQKYLCNISGYNPDIQQGTTGNGYFVPYEAQGNIFHNINSSINTYTFNNNYRINTFNYEFNSLSECLTALSLHFRNINIYVDGVAWSIVSTPQSYSITLNPTTITPVDEHGRVSWKYDEEIYIDIDLLWQLIDSLMNDPDRRIIRFSDIEDAIVDEDGQTAIAVKIVNDEDNVDEYYIKNYGTLIPVFPTDVSFPVSIDKMVSIVTVPVSVIPDDLMGVLKTLFIGTLMVCLLQRLLE